MRLRGVPPWSGPLFETSLGRRGRALAADPRRPEGDAVELPDQREGDVNLSPNRANWAARAAGAATRDLLGRDEAAFLHQSLSTPCLAAIVRAEGSWIEDADGRRYLDFHGNSVHHVGYGHPTVLAAVERQMRTLPFAPRRFTCEPASSGGTARRCGARRPLENSACARRLRGGGDCAQDRTRRDRPLQDDQLLGCLSRRRVRCSLNRGRGALSLGRDRAAAARLRTRAAVRVQPVPVRLFLTELAPRISTGAPWPARA